jgi:multidrug efflux pump subunit AcrA (membrane-fusion protein)
VKRLGILVVLIAGSAFAWKQYSKRHHEIADLPTAPARQGEFAVMIRCRGSLTARRSEQLTAPVGVQDLQIVWLAPSGTEIKEGQPVVRFDQSRLQQEVLEKRVALRQAQASLDQGEAQAYMRVEQDKVDISSTRYAMEKAKLEASKQAIVSASEGKKSSIDLGIAEEKVTLQNSSADLHVKSDGAKNASLRRLRDEAKAELDRSLQRLTLMELKSPLNGIVTYLNNRSQGWMNAQPYKAGDHVASGSAIAEIPDLSTLEMESKVEETDRGRIAEGDAVLVHVDAFPEKAFSATLSRISPLTEQSNDEWPPVSTFRAFAAINPPDPRLRPYMNAAADIIQTKLPNAISIPAKAIFTSQGQPVVYVKGPNGYQKTKVTVRARNTDEVAVEGVQAGSQVALVDPELAKK